MWQFDTRVQTSSIHLRTEPQRTMHSRFHNNTIFQQTQHRVHCIYRTLATYRTLERCLETVFETLPTMKTKHLSFWDAHLTKRKMLSFYSYVCVSHYWYLSDGRSVVDCVMFICLLKNAPHPKINGLLRLLLRISTRSLFIILNSNSQLPRRYISPQKRYAASEWIPYKACVPMLER